MLTNCSYCKKELKRKPYLIKIHKNHFCNRICENKFKEKNVNLNCSNCGKKYITKYYKIKKWKKHFCSKNCSLNCYKKDLDKNKIINLYNSGINSEELGRKLKVSPITIRNRLSDWGVELRKDIPRGEKHYFYNGGTTIFIKRIRNLTHRSNWYSNILYRDKFECIICGSSKNLEVHHIIPLEDIVKEIKLKYKTKNENEIYNISKTYEIFFDECNGITLCSKCHYDIHYDRF